jgi:gluconolactonase
VADGLRFPNGLALDREQQFLYVAQTPADNVLRFRIAGEGLSSPEVYGPQSLGARSFPDGLAFDSAGNLWVTLVLMNRLVAITPAGDIATIAEDATGALINRPSNLAFGGADLRDVYIGSIAAPYVLRGRSSVAGQPLVHQL